MGQAGQEENHIQFLWKKDAGGRYYLEQQVLQGRTDGEKLLITLKKEGTGKWAGQEQTVIFPVYQQKAGVYGEYSAYMTRHGCACCSLTAVLAAYVSLHRRLRPEETVEQVEKVCFDEKVWYHNYHKPIARQMPVSLYGISRILTEKSIPHRYIGDFQDEAAVEEIREHLAAGKPVVIETSRMKRKNGKIIRWFDKRYAGSYHTMVLLGMDKTGRVLLTDSAQREWAGEWQRLKKADLTDLISYMFPQRHTGDTHVYFHRRKNTGGYILIDAEPDAGFKDKPH